MLFPPKNAPMCLFNLDFYNPVLIQAAGLKGRGFTILCVGVTDKVNATLLQLIVSDPARQYFPVDNFQGLGNQLGSIINKVRPHPHNSLLG